MKVTIFFDGQNFYRSLLRYDEALRVDYDRLATWITQQVGGPGALFSGAPNQPPHDRAGEQRDHAENRRD